MSAKRKGALWGLLKEATTPNKSYIHYKIEELEAELNELGVDIEASLAMTGYEQVRSIAASLAGDHEAAARVELVLPDTGVCGGAGLFDDPTGAKRGSCCAPQVLQIGRAPAASLL